jgi:hypothetical protein
MNSESIPCGAAVLMKGLATQAYPLRRKTRCRKHHPSIIFKSLTPNGIVWIFEIL